MSSLGKKWIMISMPLLVLGFFVSQSMPVTAESMNSENYKIPADTMSIGGDTSNSAGYSANDTLGDWSTGEDLASALYGSCAGFQCFQTMPFVSFDVTVGSIAPGVAGIPISLGVLTTGSVVTSGSASVDSIFIRMTSSAEGGTIVSVRDANAGLARLSDSGAKIDSADATITAGTEGFGLCVFSVTQDDESPSALAKSAPYNGSCDKTSNHTVGGLTVSLKDILAASGPIISGMAEILVKAAISGTSPAGSDFSDTVTFIATSTY